MAPWHTQEHTQISNSLAHTHTHTCTEQQRLFKLLIKRLAPSSYALKLAKGVHVQEILAFLTHGLIGKPGSSNTYVILIQFLMARLTRLGLNTERRFGQSRVFLWRRRSKAARKLLKE